MRKPQVVLLLLLLAAAFQVWHYVPQLPDRVASHFNGRGEADGFFTRGDFAKLEMLVSGLLVAVFLLLPKLLSRLPASMINLPNKDYWLSEERRAGTMAALEDLMAWFGAFTLLFLLAMMQLAIRANLSPGYRFENAVALPLLGAYMAGSLLWVVFLARRFRRPA